MFKQYLHHLKNVELRKHILPLVFVSFLAFFVMSFYYYNFSLTEGARVANVGNDQTVLEANGGAIIPLVKGGYEDSNKNSITEKSPSVNESNQGSTPLEQAGGAKKLPSKQPILLPYPTLGEIAIDSEGNMFVVHSTRILKLAKDGQIVTSWGTKGDAPGQFSYRIYGIAVSKSGDVYVADEKGIDKFTNSGVYVKTFGEGEVDTPSDVAVSSEPNVYVADSKGAGIYWPTFKPPCKFLEGAVSLYTGAGDFVLEWGRLGTGGGGSFGDISGKSLKCESFIEHRPLLQGGDNFQEEFAGPTSIAVDSMGYVYAVERDAHRIQKFTSTGDFVLSFGPIKSPGKIYRPYEITAGQYIYIADEWNDAWHGYYPLKKFGSNGNFIKSLNVIAAGIALDSSGYLYVTSNVQDDGVWHGVIKKYSKTDNLIKEWKGYNPLK